VGSKPESPATGQAAKFQEQEAQALLNHANELYAQKNVNEARYQAEDLLMKYPSSPLVPEAGYLLAKIRFDQKESTAPSRTPARSPTNTRSRPPSPS